MDYLEPMTAAVRAAANIYRSAKNDLHIEVKARTKTTWSPPMINKFKIFCTKSCLPRSPAALFLAKRAAVR